MRAMATILMLAAAACVPRMTAEYDNPRQYSIEIVNDYRYALHLYYIAAGSTRVGLMAQVEARSRRTVTVPRVLRSYPDLRVLACLGRYTPMTRCTLLEGRFLFDPGGSHVYLPPGMWPVGGWVQG